MLESNLYPQNMLRHVVTFTAVLTENELSQDNQTQRFEKNIGTRRFCSRNSRLMNLV